MQSILSPNDYSTLNRGVTKFVSVDLKSTVFCYLLYINKNNSISSLQLFRSRIPSVEKMVTEIQQKGFIVVSKEKLQLEASKLSSV